MIAECLLLNDGSTPIAGLQWGGDQVIAKGGDSLSNSVFNDQRACLRRHFILSPIRKPALPSALLTASAFTPPPGS